jgi:rare lipoprotein A
LALTLPVADSRRRRGEGRLALSVLLLVVSVSTGCLHRRRPPVIVSRRPPPPTRPTAPMVQGETGLASWYGHPYHGRQTASGEIYNMYDMTAAHRTLPFGTQVRVHDLENGRNVQVRINDRGPFVEGRVIDLSYAAAQALRMPGTAMVRLQILGSASGPSPSQQGGIPGEQGGIFAVQVGAFQDRGNAELLEDAIAPHFGPVSIQTFDRGDAVFYRVRVGHERSVEAAENLGRQLRQAGFADETFVVRLN